MEQKENIIGNARKDNDRGRRFGWAHWINGIIENFYLKFWLVQLVGEYGRDPAPLAS